MTTFHLFPRLPPEVRALIWESTVEPRTVEVRVARTDTVAPESDDPRRSVRRLFSPTPVPATLQTCREARNRGLYQRAFSEIALPDGGGAESKPGESRYIWVNWDIDMISIGRTCFKNFTPVAPLIRRLRFERDTLDESFYHFEAAALRQFVNAEEIHVVCADAFRTWDWTSERHYWPCGRENVFFIDPNDGRTMNAIELDKRLEQLAREFLARARIDFDTAGPLRFELVETSYL